MKIQKNYLFEAIENFQRDYHIQPDEEFTILLEGRGAISRFTPKGMFLVDGALRIDMLYKLLSGDYEIHTTHDEEIENSFHTNEMTKMKEVEDTTSYMDNSVISHEKAVKSEGKVASLQKGLRGFELIKDFPDARLPERATKHSAGYDFYAARDLVILPNRMAIAWTGVKAYMQSDDVLKLYNRSSNPSKKGLLLANGVGVVDSDYYNNPENEGNIGFCFLNIANETMTICKGDKLGQGVFEKYNIADNDICGADRTGGFGSTDKKQ